jgi:hypothetical protein
LSLANGVVTYDLNYYQPNASYLITANYRNSIMHYTLNVNSVQAQLTYNVGTLTQSSSTATPTFKINGSTIANGNIT